MPVFNGEKTVVRAIDSLLVQTFTDFELIISDNASSDGTEKICREYAKKDKRIKYFRQLINIGATLNFQFVLKQSVGKYFFWAACDDIHSDDFIEKNVFFLDHNSDYVASTSPVRFQHSEFNEYYMGDGSLNGLISDRLMSFFCTWHANGRFYSLIRREVLSQCTEIGEYYLGSDWSVVLYLLSKGKMNRITSGWIELGKDGFSNSRNIFKKSRSRPIEIILPFWFFSKYSLIILNNNCVTRKVQLFVLFSLLKLNLRALYMSAKVSLKRKDAYCI
jgi:glycosyltransferase involved in cell wall biosynthesis